MGLLALCVAAGAQTGAAVLAPLSLDPAVAALEDAVVGAVQRSTAAVVAISARDVVPPTLLAKLLEGDRIPFTSGSGFFFRPDGYILTTDHVVHGASAVEVRLTDGRTLPARVVGYDLNTDIAVLKVDTSDPVAALPLADPESVRVGQFVLSIGSPFGLDFSVNIGIVSAKGRHHMVRDGTELIRYQDFVQTDAYINKGNSGGPLLNLRGEVVGMNAMIRTDASSDFVGLGFAIPSYILQPVATQLVQQGRVVRGWLGTEIERAEGGVRVGRVRPGSPAEKAGLKPGDLIVSFRGRPVRDYDTLRWQIASSPVGHPVRAQVHREGRPIEIEIVIGEMPPQYAGRADDATETPFLAALGLRVVSLSPELARAHELPAEQRGALIVDVGVTTLAEQAGLVSGETVVKVNDRDVQSAGECEAMVRKALEAGERSLRISLAAKGGTRQVDVALTPLNR
jgi:S1-C subfamily serine protease